MLPTWVPEVCAISAGAVTGALLRHGATQIQTRCNVKPWGIAAVNICGSFVLGAVTATTTLSPTTRLLLATGFCGSFTTFSTFSVDVVTLLQGNNARAALGYLLLNNVGGVLAAAGAMYLFKAKPLALMDTKSLAKANAKVSSPQGPKTGAGG